MALLFGYFKSSPFPYSVCGYITEYLLTSMTNQYSQSIEMAGNQTDDFSIYSVFINCLLIKNQLNIIDIIYSSI